MSALLCVFWTCAAFAEGGPFEEGNARFREGKFADAEALYRRSLAEQGESAAVRFNLGRVREALKDPGGAMLEWERALRVDVGHRDSREALAGARKLSGARVPPVQPWERIKPVLAAGLEGWILALGVWLCVASVLLRKRRASALAAGVLGMGLAVLGGLWQWQVRLERDAALVRVGSVTVRAAPADSAAALDQLPAGSRVRILGVSANWSRCLLPGGAKAWLPSESIERISPAH